VALPSLIPRDRVFFDLFHQAGQNTLRAARLLQEMLQKWPDSENLSREILLAEQEGDKITHEIIRRLNTTFVTPLDREDIFGLAGTVDDIVDYIEEAADFFGLYQIEAPMEQSLGLADIIVGCCEQLAEALSKLRGFQNLEDHWIAIHSLENDGDRLSRDAVASLFANGIDPMVVIRWKDIFESLERSVDACETVAHVLEGITHKQH